MSEVISMISSAIIFSAIFSTFLIAVDRFFAVTSPLHYSMTITRSRSQVMIVMAWLSGALISLPYIIICTIPVDTELHRSLHVFFTIIQMCIGYLFPFIGLCWLYVRMYNAAHRNSERTRKHSISGELLTAMDGSTSMIPQGMDFLTHYINPFSKTPMAGSVPPLTAAAKKHRRRSSNASSNSLFFREEGRAIKTAFLVLSSFLIFWAPYFSCLIVSEVEIFRQNFAQMVHIYGDWSRFLSVAGMLLSSVMNPFIYVFRNKMACKEVSKLLCGFLRERRGKRGHHEGQPLRRYESGGSNRSNSEYQNPHHPLLHQNNHSNIHTYTPSNKSPKRSSMKSLTPQSSLNSTITNLNCSAPDSPIIMQFGHLNHNNNNNSINGAIGTHGGVKPPFLRSLTLPEQNTAPRVKFPPNLIRQKSYYTRSSGVTELTPALSRKSRFCRQDSICSITSQDSFMVCTEDGISVSDIGVTVNNTNMTSSTNNSNAKNCGGNGTNQGNSGHSNRYLRQDSNFSDTSRKTTDSGVVMDMIKGCGVSSGGSGLNSNNSSNNSSNTNSVSSNNSENAEEDRPQAEIEEIINDISSIEFITPEHEHDEIHDHHHHLLRHHQSPHSHSHSNLIHPNNAPKTCRDSTSPSNSSPSHCNGQLPFLQTTI